MIRLQCGLGRAKKYSCDVRRPRNVSACRIFVDLGGAPQSGASVIRLVGAVRVDMHDEWQAGDRRDLSDTFMALLYRGR
jgi:hypothetical protein